MSTRNLGQSPIPPSRAPKPVPGRPSGPPGLSRSPPAPPTRPHGHSRSLGARRPAFPRPKPHPSARFHVRGRENGLQTRIPAPRRPSRPRRTPAAAPAHARAPPSAPPPVDCCGPMPPSSPITAASARARPGERGRFRNTGFRRPKKTAPLPRGPQGQHEAVRSGGRALGGRCRRGGTRRRASGGGVIVRRAVGCWCCVGCAPLHDARGDPLQRQLG